MSKTETEGEQGLRLAREYTELAVKAKEQERLIEEVRTNPRFPEDPEFLIPEMERDLQWLLDQKKRKLAEIEGLGNDDDGS